MGLFSRCTKCPAGPLEDDAGARFYFSDWGNPPERLDEYSAVINALASTGEDSSVRRVALLRYIQTYYSGSVSLERDAVAIERADKLLEAVGAHKTSMLQDVEHGRALELDALVGSVVELGRITETPTPAIDAIYAAAQLLAHTLASLKGRLQVAS